MGGDTTENTAEAALLTREIRVDIIREGGSTEEARAEAEVEIEAAEVGDTIRIGEGGRRRG